MIQTVLDELAGIIKPDDVTSSSRPAPTVPTRRGETRAMLGDEIVEPLRVINHDAETTLRRRVGRSRSAGLPQ